MRAHRVVTPRPQLERGHDRPGREPRRPGLARLVRTHPTPESVVALQRVAGNRATRQALRDSRRSPGAPVVQRAAYGLDLQPSQDAYVDHAVRLWKTQPGMLLTDFVDATMTTIAGALKASVPFFAWTFVTSGGASGVFDSEIWKVKVNVSKFSARKPPKKLRDLNPAEVTEIVGTLYHESRHADQDVVIIRSLLDQKQTPKQIHAATKIRRDVIDAVKAKKYAVPLDADQVAHAGRMFDVMYGTHKELLTFLVQHSAAFAGLDALSAQGSSLTAAAPHVRTFTTWHTRVLQPKLTRMAAATNLTTVEKAILQRLQSVDTELTAFLTAWKKVAGKSRPAASDVDDVRVLAGDARDAVNEAYAHLEGEVDAFRVEAKVKGAFSAKIATP